MDKEMEFGIYEYFECFTDIRDFAVFTSPRPKSWTSNSVYYTYIGNAKVGDKFYTITHDDGYITNEKNVIATYKNALEAIDVAKAIKAEDTSITVWEEEVKVAPDGTHYVDTNKEIVAFEK